MEFRKELNSPIVRIQKIELNNFKNVRKGEIVFNCGRHPDSQDTEVDILGIYGQNGSGKTSVIAAIAILKKVMSGKKVPPRFSDCIAEGAAYAKLTFVFGLQYLSDTDSYTRTISYSFKIKSIPNTACDKHSDFVPLYSKKIEVFDERISASGLFNGELQNRQDILTTSHGKYPIGPVRKIKEYVGSDKDSVYNDLVENQRIAAKDSKSFVFSIETLELFYQHSNNSEYFRVLLDLRQYANYYLCAIDSRSIGVGVDSYVPFNTQEGSFSLALLGSNTMSPKRFEHLRGFIKGINIVLPALVADMEIVLDYTDSVHEGNVMKDVKLFSKRKGILIPLREESDGIIKLVSILSVLISAFNINSVTVAIDELDAGIYEYLLGEILTIFETYGKGQLIFTSHNLRPLEVLSKECLIFTTSNPYNRYIRLKGVGKTNNLRSLYLREILGNTQDEQIYDAAKRQRMITAFMKAGGGYA